MVKRRKRNTKKSRAGKGFLKNRTRARKIDASTSYETCTEQLSPFGGLLALVKFFDVVEFKKIFCSFYHEPSRKPKLGHYSMMVGILMLLFIGFNRIWHFVYVRLDAMMCGFFRVTQLPAASTFWRYVHSLGINQANSLLKVMSMLCERVWRLCGFEFSRIRINIDTNVKTVYGNQQGARKGHNTPHRGKEGLRPVLCFIEEPRGNVLLQRQCVQDLPVRDGDLPMSRSGPGNFQWTGTASRPSERSRARQGQAMRSQALPAGVQTTGKSSLSGSRTTPFHAEPRHIMLMGRGLIGVTGYRGKRFSEKG